ncbi:TrbI/VirB10 family protein [Sphingomonas crusticola]|uniref:TrbI/VirB10 family protein n=1 Tax=Sphingomonas crusticola TaxID=1697973 RepID=UPI000E262E22|nr:TrbI/VirB10 family protein [Sphingomonas crusticola]
MTAEALERDEWPDEPAAKLDPATLTLRGRPPRPVRFRRRMIVGAAAVGATALAGTIWLSLRAPAPVPPADQTFRESKGPSDQVSQLPADYTAVPKLGPPLPGDLGRPILERQRQLAQDPAPAVTVDAETRQRRLDDVRAARQSGLIFPRQDAANGVAALAPVAAATGAADSSPSTVDAARDPNAQARKIGFAGALDERGDVNAHRLTAPASPYILSAGSIIPASLITGLRSDLPGLVAAQVTENVFDSASGRYLLVPQGARLVGTYDSVIAFGQRRALVVWQRIIFPDGGSVKLDNEPATDPSGYAGVADQVDFHTWTLLRGVALSTLLGAGTSFSLTGESDLVQAIRESAQRNAADAGNQLTSRNLQIQPSITVRPGFRIRLLVHRDLILAPWR